MSRTESVRGWDDGFDEFLDWLKANKKHIDGVSFHWVRGGRWRAAVENGDERRDLDPPGIRTEGDETDWEDRDTDVD